MITEQTCLVRKSIMRRKTRTAPAQNSRPESIRGSVARARRARMRCAFGIAAAVLAVTFLLPFPVRAAVQRVVVSTDVSREPKNEKEARRRAQMRATASWPTRPKLKPVGVPVWFVEEIKPPAEKHLTKRAGVFNGPSGKETWYDLDMTKVIAAMRKLGYKEEDFPYWVREDGVKMFGNFVMVAACYDLHPKGWAVETSLGTGIVVDTGNFVNTDPYQIDIAVAWKTKSTDPQQTADPADANLLQAGLSEEGLSEEE